MTSEVAKLSPAAQVSAVDSDVRSGGLFIVFEGGDGAGKTTQVTRLAASLTDAGLAHVLTRQPGGTDIGRQIRQILLDPGNVDFADRAEALLYAADKAQHVAQLICPALAAGEIVISDRYVDSMLVYQAAGRGLALDEMRQLNDWATGGLVPDLTVLLDVDPAEAVDQKAAKDRLEAAGSDFHVRVRAGFLELASQNEERYLVLPARDSIDSIAARIRARLAAQFGLPLTQ